GGLAADGPGLLGAVLAGREVPALVTGQIGGAARHLRREAIERPVRDAVPDGAQPDVVARGQAHADDGVGGQPLLLAQRAEGAIVQAVEAAGLRPEPEALLRILG